jgi:hypothetical protein
MDPLKFNPKVYHDVIVHLIPNSLILSILVSTMRFKKSPILAIFLEEYPLKQFLENGSMIFGSSMGGCSINKVFSHRRITLGNCSHK